MNVVVNFALVSRLKTASDTRGYRKRNALKVIIRKVHV